MVLKTIGDDASSVDDEVMTSLTASLPILTMVLTSSLFRSKYKNVRNNFKTKKSLPT